MHAPKRTNGAGQYRPRAHSDAAEMKAALAQSDQVVTPITSDHFYSDVIQQDPGTAPRTCRQIHVIVKTFSRQIWLWLTGDVATGGESGSYLRQNRHPTKR